MGKRLGPEQVGSWAMSNMGSEALTVTPGTVAVLSQADVALRSSAAAGETPSCVCLVLLAGATDHAQADKRCAPSCPGLPRLLTLSLLLRWHLDSPSRSITHTSLLKTPEHVPMQVAKLPGPSPHLCSILAPSLPPDGPSQSSKLSQLSPP